MSTIQRGQVAYIVTKLRDSSLSPKDVAVRKQIDLLKSAVRQAQIVGSSLPNKAGHFETLELTWVVKKVKEIIRMKGGAQIKRQELDKLLGKTVSTADMDNYYKGEFGVKICYEEYNWQESIAKGVVSNVLV